MIEVFGLKLCPLELLTDEKTNRLSSTKMWMHIGYTVLTYALLQHIKTNPLTLDLILGYGGLVAGHHSLIFFLRKKYGGDQDAGNTETPQR